MQIGHQENMGTVVAEHIKKRKSLNTKIIDKMQERVGLHDDFRLAQKEYQRTCGTQNPCCIEATSMRAIKKVVTVADKKEVEPVVPPPWPTRPETVSVGHEGCQEACSLDDCPIRGLP